MSCQAWRPFSAGHKKIRLKKGPFMFYVRHLFPASQKALPRDGVHRQLSCTMKSIRRLGVFLRLPSILPDSLQQSFPLPGFFLPKSKSFSLPGLCCAEDLGYSDLLHL